MRRPHPIEVESYRILRSRADTTHFPPLTRAVVERVVHTTADTTWMGDIVADEAALAAGRAALLAGAPIVVDVRMVAAGITSRDVVVALDLADESTVEGPTRPGTGTGGAIADLAIGEMAGGGSNRGAGPGVVGGAGSAGAELAGERSAGGGGRVGRAGGVVGDELTVGWSAGSLGVGAGVGGGVVSGLAAGELASERPAQGGGGAVGGAAVLAGDELAGERSTRVGGFGVGADGVVDGAWAADELAGGGSSPVEAGMAGRGGVVGGLAGGELAGDRSGRVDAGVGGREGVADGLVSPELAGEWSGRVEALGAGVVGGVVDDLAGGGSRQAVTGVGGGAGDGRADAGLAGGESSWAVAGSGGRVVGVVGGWVDAQLAGEGSARAVGGGELGVVEDLAAGELAYERSDGVGGGATRAAAGICAAARRWPDGAVWVIGNAPTALATLVELACRGEVRPALVVGMPVGFVGAVAAKAALRASGLPAVSSTTERGGAAVAAAALNALLYAEVADA